MFKEVIPATKKTNDYLFLSFLFFISNNFYHIVSKSVKYQRTIVDFVTTFVLFLLTWHLSSFFKDHTSVVVL